VSEAEEAVEGVKKNVWRSEYRFVLAEKYTNKVSQNMYI
jgi:hypothetical protein